MSKNKDCVMKIRVPNKLLKKIRDKLIRLMKMFTLIYLGDYIYKEVKDQIRIRKMMESLERC